MGIPPCTSFPSLPRIKWGEDGPHATSLPQSGRICCAVSFHSFQETHYFGMSSGRHHDAFCRRPHDTFKSPLALIVMWINLSASALCAYSDVVPALLKERGRHSSSNNHHLAHFAGAHVAAAGLFTLCAVFTHAGVGIRRIPGYRLWQPFEGGTAFVLMQGFGWLSFAVYIHLVLLLLTATARTHASPLAPSEPLLSALLMRSSSSRRHVLLPLALLGAVGQTLLFASLPLFEAPRAKPASAAAARFPLRSGDTVVSAALLIGGFVMMITCASCGGGISPTFTTPRMLLPQVEPSRPQAVSACIGVVAIFLAAPIAHVGACVSQYHRGYRFWQPFEGGAPFVLAQGFGWFMYGAGMMLMLVVVFNFSNGSPISSSSLVLDCTFVGACVAVSPIFVSANTIIVLSTGLFDKRRAPMPSSVDVLQPPPTPTPTPTTPASLQPPPPPRGRRTMRASTAVAMAAFVLRVYADGHRDLSWLLPADEVRVSADSLRPFSMGGFAVSMFICHAIAGGALRGASALAPLSGGVQHTALAGSAWMFFAVAIAWIAFWPTVAPICSASLGLLAQQLLCASVLAFDARGLGVGWYGGGAKVSKGTLTNLPHDVLRDVMAELTEADVANLAATCRLFGERGGGLCQPKLGAVAEAVERKQRFERARRIFRVLNMLVGPERAALCCNIRP